MSYIICVMIGAAVLCFAVRSMLFVNYCKINKEAENMGKSSHSLLKTLMKRFQTSYELKMEIKNVDIYVEKYLRSYKKAGMSLAAWETWGEALFAAVVLGCIGVNAYLIWSKTSVQWAGDEEWSSVSVFCATLLPCFVLYMQDMVLNLTERRERGKVEIVDYLENVCQPRMKNEFFHPEEMQEYRKEYFDKERKQLDKLLQPEQIQFTKEEQKVIEEVLKEYMA